MVLPAHGPSRRQSDHSGYTEIRTVPGDSADIGDGWYEGMPDQTVNLQEVWDESVVEYNDIVRSDALMRVSVGFEVCFFACFGAALSGGSIYGTVGCCAIPPIAVTIGPFDASAFEDGSEARLQAAAEICIRGVCGGVYHNKTLEGGRRNDRGDQGWGLTSIGFKGVFIGVRYTWKIGG